MEYIDYRKKSEKENKKEDEIQNDKVALMRSIMTKTTQEKEQIVDRLYEINDIGAIDLEEHLVTIVKEAEWLYAYGFNLGCIAVVGLVTEEFSKILANKNDISKISVSNQKERIEVLLDKNIINEDTAERLNYIRLNRNHCIHYKRKFKNLSEEDTQINALKTLNYFKGIIANYYEQIDLFESGVLPGSNSDELALILRNAMARNENIDLTISDKNYIYMKKVFKIVDIDVEGTTYKEMTFLDIEIDFCLIVDLTYSQADYVTEIGLRKDQYIIASCISIITANGLTETWHLLNIDEILC